MKFESEKLDGQAVIYGYDDQGVVINGQKYAQSVLFGVDLPPEAWPDARPGKLSLDNAQTLLDRSPDETEVVLIGTGENQQFPSKDVRRFFVQNKVPVEFMDSQAACRTYNILIGEGRKVVAGLLQEPA
ncbi:MAG: Mth938-like domain-containing protein [Limnobacter sp.]|nr:Mth938-like domain-containing protein [Limnobacter sp.]